MYIRYPVFYNIMPFYDKRISMASDIPLDYNNVNLVLDSQNYYTMPNHFRKSTDIINSQSNKNINLSGLKELNISGSQQFSEFNLPLIINSIGHSFKIIVVDLRQESHGFINGNPISWANALNDANKGLTFKEVMTEEYIQLKSIKLGIPITFYNHKNITIVPSKVEDENHLVNSKSLAYVRIPVTDGKIPTDDMVDYFVLLVKSQPKDTWLHFHCKQGIGRTTTFMIMYDMMKNSKEVSADDIINRQLLLANFDDNHIKSFNNNERINFLQSFYKYCQEHSDDLY